MGRGSLLAVNLAPTDAALGQAVVTLMRLPSPLTGPERRERPQRRHLRSLVWIVLATAQAESGAIGDGTAARLVIEQIGYGILAGVLAGVAAARVVVVAGGHGGTSVAPGFRSCHWPAAGLAAGVADPIGGFGFIAAFVGGVIFGALRQRSGGEVGHLIEEVGEVLTGVTFVVFGAVLFGPVLGA